MKYYIETFTPKQAWLDLPKEERAAYMTRVGLSSQPFLDEGGEVVLMSENDSDTVKGLNHRYFVVWKFMSDQSAKSFEALGIREGWYDYFDQFNLKGSPSDIIDTLVNI
ncbi:hypothetical protein SAMN04487995_6189 [Dyadobacter koreensis]|uniref:Uncharacterized protein n=1 Tax=Dyadobacter koreensis TaxID=408657 RepID=A0A1H7BH91_9BACT|nr:DUF6616 family protein [Dyadobacter koreensis]SEJ73590.1 hypothetical protein SAMN04487995_6189 [Dyadobacter koreensis]